MTIFEVVKLAIDMHMGHEGRYYPMLPTWRWCDECRCWIVLQPPQEQVA